MRCCAGLVAAAAVLLLGSGTTSEAAAWALFGRVHELNHTTRAWKDRSQRLLVTIVDRRNNERRRSIDLFTRKEDDDSSRSILFFLSPPEVEGIGLLQWIGPQREDRHWLYLPALKRVRQITGSSRRESFVGTDFSFEDLTLIQEILDWTRQDAEISLAGEEVVDEHVCAMIDVLPKDADVGYGKIRLWLDKDESVVRRFTFEDRNGRLAKTLLLSDIRMVKQIPAAHRMEMRNERTGSHTVIEFSKIVFDSGLSEGMFTQRRLEKGI
jgi:outer membrane lipoprotein-sorting protein